MEHQSNNPLSSYFRNPAIYLKLPSRGRWWPSNSLTLPTNGEIAVKPMSTRDEILLKTPDALMNGQGVVDVIQSCCPDIKNAWDMPSVDVDSVLISIRIASFGNKMAFDSTCPHCQENNNHELALENILSAINCPDYNDPVQFLGLKIKLKPQRYFDVNRTNILQFEEAKILSTLQNNDIAPEDKAAAITDSVTKLVSLGVDLTASSTEYIELPDGTRVSDKEQLQEFYNNCERELTSTLQDRFNELNNQGRLKPYTLLCGSCQTEYLVEVEFDYASFFGKGF